MNYTSTLSYKADSQPKSAGLVCGSAAAWHYIITLYNDEAPGTFALAL